MANEIINLATNRAYKIEIFSFSNPKESQFIEFPAFLTDFSDSYKSNWRSEEIMGKMDPVVTFKNTIRTISLVFDVPNESREEAIRNTNQMAILIRGLYPIYDKGKYGTAVMVSPPMFRVRFSNLIRNVGQVADGQINKEGDEGPSTLRTGLLSYISQFDFKPDVSAGFFVDDNAESLYPKLLKATLNLNIIHENPLGKYKNGSEVLPRVSFDNFPYGPPVTSSAEPEMQKEEAVTTPPENTKEEANTQRSFKKCLNFE